MSTPDVHVVDAAAALALAEHGHEADDTHEFFAPTLLRADVLAACLAQVHDGDMEPSAGLDLAERACRLPRRLLGDAVLRRNAWALAVEHGWHDTGAAHYIALTRLHGTALVAGADDLRTLADPLVVTLTVDQFLTDHA